MSSIFDISAVGHAIPVVSMEDLERDPHQIYKYYRQQTPVIRRADGPYLVLRASAFEAFYDETKTRQLETEYLKMRGINDGPLWDAVANSMLYSNGAVHRRRRAPVARAFAHRMIEGLRPSIRRVAEEILDQHHAKGGMDLLTDYASLIPARTVASIIGLPHADIRRFTANVYAFSKFFSGAWKDEDLPGFENAASALQTYIQEILAARTTAPQDGFIDDYLEATERASDLSELEIIMQLVTLVIAGSDTTRGAIVSQTSLLLHHRDQWNLLLEEPERIPSAVQECLRYEPIAGSIPRFTVDDIDLDGYVVPRNSVVLLMTISALRDEEMFSAPETFDISRPPPKWNIVFGGGAHRCLGEALAKAELEESLAVLLQRYPNMHLVEDYRRLEGHGGIRRVENVKIRWS